MESLYDVWNAVCEESKKYITEVGYNVWIKDLKPVEQRPGEFVVSIYSNYKKQIIEMNYLEILENCLKDVMGVPTSLKVLFADENGEIIENAEEEPEEGSFESNYTFENFIVGSSNRFAHAASMAVAENAVIIYNPLVIYGNSGVGKTHLMLAIKNRVSKLYPKKKIEYIRGEDFTNNLIMALRDGTIDEFRNRFRKADMLLMDDIHFIAGKESTMEEFFNTFNTLYQAGRQIVVTSDRPPKDIKTLDERIRSRFESGILADITPPDFETRVGIVNTKAAMLNLTLDENLVYYIAEHIKMNTRQLEGVVKKLQAYVQLQNRVPTLSVVQGFIRDIINDHQPEPIKIEEIIKAVSDAYQVPEKDIISKRKTAPVVFARQVAMYIARETTELSYKAIGDSFGKDHTTVLYTVDKIEKHLKNQPFEREMVDEIIKNLKSES